MTKAVQFYHVVILTETGWTLSRIFNTKRAAGTYAKWCSARWDAIIYKGCVGGARIADYPRLAKSA